MEQSAPKSNTVYTYGLYLGIASIAYSLVIFYGGFIGNKVFNYLGYLIVIAFIVLGLKYYRDKVNNGVMSYSQGLGIGVLISLIGSLVSSVFSYVLMSFIDTSLHQVVSDMAMEEALKGGVPEAQIDQVQSMVEIFTSPGAMFAMGLFFGVLGGFVVSLIAAAIFKKEDNLIA